MKKILLTAVSLYSVLSFSKTTGYINADVQPGFKGMQKYRNEKEDLYFGEAKIDMGIYLDSNKDNMIFANGRIAQDSRPDREVDGFIGAFTKNDIDENTKVSVKGLYRLPQSFYIGAFDIKRYTAENPRETIVRYLKDNGELEGYVYIKTV
ncbi:hypothetical protein STFE110948_06175 [Streptobacillus felis]|uniref:hypothetical protein n=1 Tax=Streptobacillus felis TaxID=1384509 RepID=UPI0008365EB2|nr:hypothetical protein [Streptobacillus felis]